MKSLPDAEALYAELRDAVKAAVAALPPGSAHLVGIYSGGAWLAERLHADLGLPERHGALNISFYRDDFDRIGLHHQVQPTDIPFAVEGSHIILVDDVLYTGRTIRGAMNELFDYGRPASIQLAVLVDRGGRQLPVAAALAAARLTDVPDSASINLTRGDDGRFALALEDAANA
ncbi:bifunctional pyr operon transcriptional regulator/uracil phosphoribosyltransferase PyrR [Achromobacter sp. GG226]|uniref:bifunctional pyr operon transcriptional regulator/uracil phosphoribosyltransferase PyrR n=1 Tax=Verticiella alkaliphila TaxID=2779529 RepID=UPI001C0D9125|nr:bifunctional pyr operon transcriptional regulator/uracil phosphoribosyltransferase PyrR [Verticiella sp. GG226]MBU4612341.1 bifunctional pyr operon transcriptional regulator/uracil phosphoribosyltransferase PyrR [Verticiella sp. GG226]